MPAPGLPVVGSLSGLDAAVIAGYFVLVTWLGLRLAGRQRSVDDFFRGGGRLPWYAVSGSMIATIVSAVTFVAVPAVAFRDGGDFTYLQLGLVSGLLSRVIVAVWLIPAYYRHGVLSPYDFMAARRGPAARTVATLMFTAMGVASQSVRVYLTAVVLTLVLAGPLNAASGATGLSPMLLAVLLIAAVAAAWTARGGVATVVWTDALLLLVFVVGGLTALAVVVHRLPGGAGGLWRAADAAGKLRLWELSATPDLTRPYTLWAAGFAVTLGNVGQYGVDQLLAQRLLCCRSPGAARLALLVSWLGEAVVALMLAVGVGLWAYYRGAFPERLGGAAGALVEADADRVFPVFILREVPAGLRGLIVAGILAAAVSSLTSALAALAQTTLAVAGRAAPTGDAARLRASRGLVLAWSLVLAAAAWGLDVHVRVREAAGADDALLDLALALPGYLLGGLFGAVVLAWLPLQINARGMAFAAPLSVLAVWVSRTHPAPAGAGLHPVLAVAASVLLAIWLTSALRGPLALRAPRIRRTSGLLTGLGSLWLLHRLTCLAATDGAGCRGVAWPWYAPIGAGYMILFGVWLADRHPIPPRDAVSGRASGGVSGA